MTNKTTNNFDNERGAILITLAIFVLIAGIAVASYAYVSNIRLQEERQEKIEEQYATIMGAMSKYVARNSGYKPCPAAIAVPETSDEFGLQTDCLDTATVAPGAGATLCNTAGAEENRYCVFNDGTRRIRFGVVPYKALKIDKEDIIDPYGNLYSYAVVEHRADGTNSPPLPADYNIITVNETQLLYDGANWTPQVTAPTPLTDMVVYSHGLDGRGSWLQTGQANPAACAGAGLDIENCDNDNVFNLALTNDNAGANYFDDLVERDITAWTYIWNDTADVTSTGIFNQGPKASGVGTDNPDEDFHVAGGGALVEEDPAVIPEPASPAAGIADEIKPTGAAVTPQYCNIAGDCFDPSLFGAPQSSSENAECNNRQYLRGFANGDPQCVNFVTMGPNSACTTYVRGITYGGTPPRLNVICGP